MRITVSIGLGLALAANGLSIRRAGTPSPPACRRPAPLNPHFVRDIGCAYILTGFALAGFAFNEREWRQR